MENNINKDILAGDFDANLGSMLQAIQLRQEQIKSKSLASLKVGDVIRLSNSTRPRYLAGVSGTITNFKRTKIVIDLEYPVTGPQGKRWQHNITVPTSLVEVV